MKNVQVLELIRLKYATVAFIRETKSVDNKMQAYMLMQDINKQLQEVKDHA